MRTKRILILGFLSAFQLAAVEVKNPAIEYSGWVADWIAWTRSKARVSSCVCPEKVSRLRQPGHIS